MLYVYGEREWDGWLWVSVRKWQLWSTTIRLLTLPGKHTYSRTYSHQCVSSPTSSMMRAHSSIFLWLIKDKLRWRGKKVLNFAPLFMLPSTNIQEETGKGRVWWQKEQGNREANYCLSSHVTVRLMLHSLCASPTISQPNYLPLFLQQTSTQSCCQYNTEGFNLAQWNPSPQGKETFLHNSIRRLLKPKKAFLGTS